MEVFDGIINLFTNEKFDKLIDNLLKYALSIMLLFMVWYDSQLVCAQHTRDLFYMIKKYPELVFNSTNETDMINKINSESDRMKSCQLTCSLDNSLNNINSSNKIDIGISSN